MKFQRGPISRQMQPDYTYNVNDNLRINMLMSENVRQKRVKMLKHFEIFQEL